MATLTKVQSSLSPASISWASCAGGGDEFVNDGNTLVMLRKTGATNDPVTATFDAPGVDDFGVGPDASHDVTASLSTGESEILGPFPTKRFNDANDKVQITYDNVDELEIIVFAAK